MKRTLLLLLFLLPLLASAQTGMLWNRYYISGSLSLGKGDRSFADTGAWLELGRDTTKKGLLLPRVILDSITTTKRGLFVYDLKDSVLYHFDGGRRVRYMTYKDTALVKQLIQRIASYTAGYGLALTAMQFKADTAVIAPRSYVDALSGGVLLRNGNTNGVDIYAGTNDRKNLRLETNDTTRALLDTAGRLSLLQCDVDTSLSIKGKSAMPLLSVVNNSGNAGLIVGSATVTGVSAPAFLSLGGTYNSSANDPVHAKVILTNAGGAAIYGLGTSVGGGTEYFTGNGKQTMYGNLYLGTTISGGTSSPPFISLGSNYNSTANDPANAKLKIVDNGSCNYGISASAANGMEYFGGCAAKHTFFGNAVFNSDVSAKGFCTAIAISDKTANYTLTNNDDQITVDASSADITITLPTTGIATGRIFNIKKVNATNNVILDPAGSATIDGSTTYSFSTQWKNVQVIFNGTNFLIRY